MTMAQVSKAFHELRSALRARQFVHAHEAMRSESEIELGRLNCRMVHASRVPPYESKVDAYYVMDNETNGFVHTQAFTVHQIWYALALDKKLREGTAGQS